MDRTAMGAIEPGRRFTVFAQQTTNYACIGTTLGTMGVQNIDLQPLYGAVKPFDDGEVTQTDSTIHGDAVQAKIKKRLKVSEILFFECAARVVVADHANGMAAPGLTVNEIAHMAENTADRRAEAVNNPQRLEWLAHGA